MTPNLHSIVVLFLLTTAAPAQSLILASKNSGGQIGNGDSFGCFVSADGRFVAFQSTATNLVPGDTNNLKDVFVRDLLTNQTTRVSVSTAGAQANNHCHLGGISGDGNVVAFVSYANNLVAGDTNLQDDIFVHERSTGVTSRVTLTSTGTEPNGSSFASLDISHDGRYVAFSSNATNFDAADVNGTLEDIYLRDRQAGTTTLVSKNSAGLAGNHMCRTPRLTPDARYVVFVSTSNNLVDGYTMFGWAQVYRRDLQNGVTELVSTAYLPQTSGNNPSDTPDISADGNIISFQSVAQNLDVLDTNLHGDIYVKNMSTGQVSGVSVSSTGGFGNFQSALITMVSDDGRYVLFQSHSTNLTPGTSGAGTFINAFRRDLVMGQTTLLSKTPAGVMGNQTTQSSYISGVSGDGRVCAFTSNASNFVNGDTNSSVDIFVALDAPVIEGTSPAVAPLAGGIPLTITGANLWKLGAASATAVLVGGVNAAIVSISDTELVVIAPAGAAGAVSLDIQTSYGNTTAAGALLYTSSLESYGSGTAGCSGAHTSWGGSLPQVGNAGFTIDNGDSPASSLGLCLIADAQDLSGSDPFGLGLLLHVDLFAAAELLGLDAFSNPSGDGSCAAAIPANPLLTGTTWYAQTIWAWSSCSLPPYGLSATPGLRITIQP